MRVPQQPYLRVDRNDYSLDPALRRAAGSRCASPRREVTAVVLDTGELACRHRRVVRRRPHAHRARASARSSSACAAAAVGRDVEVEIRPLARYDALIPA